MSIIQRITPIASTNKSIQEILNSIDNRVNTLGYIKDEYSWYYGIFDDNDTTRLVGFSKFKEPEDVTTELETIAIHQAFQGIGYGSKLLSCSIHHLQIRFPHLQKIFVQDGHAAPEFYEKHGFVATGKGRNRILIKELEEIRVPAFFSQLGLYKKD